jgi:hypothetical protein
MLSAPLEKNTDQNSNNFVAEEKGKLLKACADIAILSELNKRAGISGSDVIFLFKDKYGVRIFFATTMQERQVVVVDAC